MPDVNGNSIAWLLLIHQVPNSPAYLRVKMWRRLQRLGAVAVKNAVYVLPKSEQSFEDFQWVANEISARGGEATVCEATFLDGMTNSEVVDLFSAARAADYAQLMEDLTGVEEELKKAIDNGDGAISGLTARASRLRQRLTEIRSIDFFACAEGPKADATLSQLESRLRKNRSPRKVERTEGAFNGRVWVTRKGIHIDRIASAWLIRKFIDPRARFKFVPPKGYSPEPGELRFDMFNAEFTHQGNRCTFEVLVDRMNLADRALVPIAEVIHDVDLKESKFARPETEGLALMIAAICTANKEDKDRLERGSALLDDLYEFYKRR